MTAPSTDLRDRLDHETRDLLLDRLRGFAMVAAVGIGVSLLTDTRAVPPVAPIVPDLKAGALGLLGLFLVALRALATERRRLVSGAGLAVVAAVCVVPLAGGIATGDPVRGLYVTSFVALGAAVAVPWGGLPQGALVALLALEAAIALGVAATMPPAQSLVAAGAATGASVWVAATLERERVGRRRAELALEEQARHLAVARDAAVAATRAKSTFLANMSHELRTPLNGVIGLADVLADSALDGQQRDLLQRIRRCGTTLLALVRDLLDLSAIEAGRVALHPAPFDLTATVHDVLDLVAPAAAAKGLELAGHVAPDCPVWFEGDGARVAQVLANLVGNAVKFTDRGEVVVEVQSGPARDGGSVVITVRDTGIGIPPEMHAHIFEAFAQVDASWTRRHDGTGLGLAVTRELVTRMGGRIEVASAPGVGSVFTVTLSLAPLAPPRPRAAAARLRVLVVDDHPATRNGLVAVLARLGCDAVAAATLDEAADRVGAAAPGVDLVLLDAALGGLADGRRTAAVLDGCAVVTMTGIGTRGPARGDEVLVKPVRPEAVAGVVGRYARREPGDAPRVLVVGDDPANQRPLRAMVARLGWAVDSVEDGRGAVEACARTAYAAVLMDVQLPESNGLEATHEIRRRETHRPAAVPIIAVTAQSSDEDRRRCFAAGVDDCLAKPVTLGALAAVLGRVGVPVAGWGSEAA